VSERRGLVVPLRSRDVSLRPALEGTGRGLLIGYNAGPGTLGYGPILADDPRHRPRSPDSAGLFDVKD
jgi:hypothetical protein